MYWIRLPRGEYLNLDRVETVRRHSDVEVTVYWPPLAADTNRTVYTDADAVAILAEIDDSIYQRRFDQTARGKR